MPTATNRPKYIVYHLRRLARSYYILSDGLHVKIVLPYFGALNFKLLQQAENSLHTDALRKQKLRIRACLLTLIKYPRDQAPPSGGHRARKFWLTGVHGICIWWFFSRRLSGWFPYEHTWKMRAWLAPRGRRAKETQGLTNLLRFLAGFRFIAQIRLYEVSHHHSDPNGSSFPHHW